jgi:hypothetical protein
MNNLLSAQGRLQIREYPVHRIRLPLKEAIEVLTAPFYVQFLFPTSLSE